MKRPHHIDRVDPEARPAPRAAAFVEREARWDDTATKLNVEKPVLMLARRPILSAALRCLPGCGRKLLSFGSHVIGYRDDALLRALEPVAVAPATQLPDGIWTVQGRAVQGTRRCGDWLGLPDQ